MGGWGVGRGISRASVPSGILESSGAVMSSSHASSASHLPSENMRSGTRPILMVYSTLHGSGKARLTAAAEELLAALLDRPCLHSPRGENQRQCPPVVAGGCTGRINGGDVSPLPRRQHSARPPHGRQTWGEADGEAAARCRRAAVLEEPRNRRGEGAKAASYSCISFLRLSNNCV